MLLEGTLEKANGRTTSTRRKLAALREDDERHTRATTGDMDVDGEDKPVNDAIVAEREGSRNTPPAFGATTRNMERYSGACRSKPQVASLSYNSSQC
ncbi:hypothetical protein PM082_004763 [Marasmius tenuissimus]|nr:hypothetical protein PM082_004763 [Marasmius tenuissimus]